MSTINAVSINISLAKQKSMANNNIYIKSFMLNIFNSGNILRNLFNTNAIIFVEI
ncbi:hypothetical protein DOY81_000368 [Sarcophaga bullata]|nr:hypothetical protein DOY81_000368 [Sarcophaga bullata]